MISLDFILEIVMIMFGEFFHVQRYNYYFNYRNFILKKRVFEPKSNMNPFIYIGLFFISYFHLSAFISVKDHLAGHNFCCKISCNSEIIIIFANKYAKTGNTSA